MQEGAWGTSATHTSSGALETSGFFSANSNPAQIRKLQQQNSETAEEETSEGDGRGVFWNDWKDWTWTQKTYFIISWSLGALFMLFCCYTWCLRRDQACLRWHGRPAPRRNASA